MNTSLGQLVASHRIGTSPRLKAGFVSDGVGRAEARAGFPYRGVPNYGIDHRASPPEHESARTEDVPRSVIPWSVSIAALMPIGILRGRAQESTRSTILLPRQAR